MIQWAILFQKIITYHNSVNIWVDEVHRLLKTSYRLPHVCPLSRKVICVKVSITSWSTAVRCVAGHMFTCRQWHAMLITVRLLSYSRTPPLTPAPPRSTSFCTRPWVHDLKTPDSYAFIREVGVCGEGGGMFSTTATLLAEKLLEPNSLFENVSSFWNRTGDQWNRDLQHRDLREDRFRNLIRNFFKYEVEDPTKSVTTFHIRYKRTVDEK